MNSRSFNLDCDYSKSLTLSIVGALSIHPEVSVGTSKGTDHLGLVRSENSEPAFNVLHFDRSGHFGRSDRDVSFHLSKLFLIVAPQYRTFVSSLQERVVPNDK